MIQTNTEKIGELETTIVREKDLNEPQAAVILCHGFGAPGTDLVPLGNELIRSEEKLGQAVYLFPSAPLELDPMFDSRAWWMIDMEKIQLLMATGESREMRNESPERLPECRKMLDEVIDYVRTTWALPPEKIIVGGFSQGSMLATDVALNYPARLGGLIVWSGALINEPLWTEKAREQEKLKVVQTHGTIDPILPVQGGEYLHQMLMETGHSAKFQKFMGPHTIPVEGYQMASELIVQAVEDN